ncbi:MAG: YidC/Oxa1 family membrane protein insertase [Candidatus Absconditabacterales bacterium]|nr:YidC/Oxa1 family membrane protein insertase [Candidatus Absconditabacterales bacterium]
MYQLFQTIFYQPILNLVIFLYNNLAFQDLGLAIIILTFIIKAILWPLSRKSIESQKALQEIQPKIDELKAKYKDDKQLLGQELMSLYKKNNVNPFSSCLPLLIQLPFFIAVFQVFKDGIDKHLDLVYPFITKPEFINSTFLGFMDLSKPVIYLAVLAGAAQFWQAKMMMAKRKQIKSPEATNSKTESMTAIMNKQMLYFMPALTIFIGVTLPGGLTLYWFILTLLTVLQQSLVNKKDQNQGLIEGQIVS